MLENVNNAGTDVLAEGKNSDMVTIPRTEYNRLVFERDEYRSMCLDFAQRLPKFHEIADNIDRILADGGASE